MNMREAFKLAHKTWNKLWPVRPSAISYRAARRRVMDNDQEIERIHQLCCEVLAELDVDELFNPPMDSIEGRVAIRPIIHQAMHSVVGKAQGLVTKREFGLEMLLEALICLAADRQNKLDQGE